jgi:uncharacterized protein
MNSTTHHSIQVRASGIHGMGAFATANIPPDTRIIEYVGELIDKQESLARCENNNQFIFCLDDSHDIDGSVEWNLAKYINHSCSPNCAAELIGKHVWIVSLRQIHPGEEITFNYGYDLEDYRDYPCRCGSPQCAGYIVAEEFMPQVRMRNKKLIPAPAPNLPHEKSVQPDRNV